ncbi:MAG: hypothetical protein Q9170_001437 [Blastenia crenularia]
MEQECQKLRLELKEWEKTFAAANEGKKAGREDIKQNPEIANRYKLYNKLRAGDTSALGKRVEPTQDPSPKKRHARKPPRASTETPQKRSKHLPGSQHDLVICDQAPEPAQNTPVAHRKSIGPTPQKNGRVLGLFDLLTPSSTFHTPLKRRSLASLPPNIVETPSGPRKDGEKTPQDEPPISSKRRCRSPPSASKRTYLASFLTPSTRRVVDINSTPKSSTPVSKLKYGDTPAFLKRDSQRFLQGRNTCDDNVEEEMDSSSWSPVAVRVMRRKPAGRALSAIVKGLRELEEAQLDDDLEMLRELEGERNDAPESQVKSLPKVFVEDSQLPDMPLGPDGENGSESEDMEALEAESRNRNGKPLKVWKKKGQKRTTRRVNIKPNTARWKPEPEWKGGVETEDEGQSEDGVAIVEETQFIAPIQVMDPNSDAEDIQTDEAAPDEGEAQAKTDTKEVKLPGKSKKIQKEQPKEKKKGPVSATAHANFRALKIKNKHSKGKGRGRFGRRR